MPRVTRQQVLEAARRRWPNFRWDVTENHEGVYYVWLWRDGLQQVCCDTLAELLAKIGAGGSGEKSEKPA
jgi:hypothetical protein